MFKPRANNYLLLIKLKITFDLTKFIHTKYYNIKITQHSIISCEKVRGWQLRPSYPSPNICDYIVHNEKM